MASTSPARVDDALYSSAKLAGAVQSRSASQQVVHWARIGREIEASLSISPREIAEVLAGSQPYDGLNPKEQAIVRAEWSTRIDQFRNALDLAEEFSAAGRGWVELDDSGAVVDGGGPISARRAGPTAPTTPKAAVGVGARSTRSTAPRRKVTSKKAGTSRNRQTGEQAKARAKKDPKVPPGTTRKQVVDNEARDVEPRTSGSAGD